MKRDLNINVHHLTRVEGHGNINVSIKNGKISRTEWAVVETPRFFEAMLRGMSHKLAPVLTARICGICSIGHAMASLRAVERAMDVDVPPLARKLRLLAKHGETMQSHFLHLFFLAAPDFFGAPSVIPLIKSHPDIVAIAARLKGLANDMCDLVAGRTTHPVSLAVGGMAKMPGEKDLVGLRVRLTERLADVRTTVDLFKTLEMPDFERETEHVSLKSEGNYPWIGGKLVSSDGVVKSEDDYLDMTNEYKEDFTTSKFARLSRDSYAVGALARLNNNYDYLFPEAQQTAKTLDLSPISHNPFMINIAQLVECHHVMLESIAIIDELLSPRDRDFRHDYAVKAGEGVGAVEVPRGILYHHYIIDKHGKIVKANCIIPTTQNNANIHHDLRELVEVQVKREKSDEEIKLLCEMLVRAYDPCISCSVH
jgi:sulfhydrogenase subunit alpha